jgi:hypothetical protein
LVSQRQRIFKRIRNQFASLVDRIGATH